MKTHILIFLLFLAGISAPVSTTAQSGKARISFDYNESGERISRKVIYLDTQEKTQIKEQKEEVRAAVVLEQRGKNISQSYSGNTEHSHIGNDRGRNWFLPLSDL